MKKWMIAAFPLTFVTMGAHAQSSVTLYGIVDLGVDYVNNVANANGGKLAPGGGRTVQMQSGVPAGSRWGLKGTEDLGGGLHAIFRLESGFNASNGAAGGGGLAFSRNAYVGVQSDRYGTLTFGKQWDANVDLVEPYSLNYNYGGWYFSHPNDVDNLDDGFPVNNAVKYVSPTFGGLVFEGHYSFGGQAGQFSTNSSYSAAAQYTHGPFGVAVGYLHVYTPITAVAGYASGGSFVNAVYGNALAAARSQGVLAAGASYTFGNFKLMGDFSSVNFQSGNGGHDVRFQNYEVSGIYTFSPSFSLAAGYTFTTGLDHATDAEPKYHQGNLAAVYNLSKRTSVYVMGSYQRAAGAAQNAQIAGFNPSTSQTQVVGRLGITHLF